MKRKFIALTLIVSVVLFILVGCNGEEVKEEGSHLIDEAKEEGKELKEGAENQLEKGKEEAKQLEIKEKMKLKLHSYNIDFKMIHALESMTEKNEDMETAIINYLKYDGQEEVRYFYNYADLDGTGNETALVYLLTDDGSKGKLLLIDAYSNKVLGEIDNISTPLIIANEKTEGFKDIIAPVKLEEGEDYFVRLRYDGMNYPDKPSKQLELEKDIELEGFVVLADKLSFEEGILLD